MEDWQKRQINRNIDKLIQFTVLNTRFTTTLMANGVLDTSDMWELDAISNQGMKLLKFYEIIQYKSGDAFNHLVKAFESTRQTAGLSILQQKLEGEVIEEGEGLVTRGDSDVPVIVDATPKIHGMEDWQKKHIVKNLDALVDSTHLNVSLMAILQDKRILDTADMWELDAVSNRGMKILKFYDIVQRKQNAYKELITAFERIQSSGVVQILKAAEEYKG